MPVGVSLAQHKYWREAELLSGALLDSASWIFFIFLTRKPVSNVSKE